MSSKRSARISSACKIHNDVAILWSRDSANAISFMPYGWRRAHARSWTGDPTATSPLVQQMHHSLYDLNIGADFVFPETTGLLALQAADRSRALYLRRCAAATDLRLCEKRRSRRDDLQERIRQRKLRRPLGARARSAPRGRRLQLSGILQPRTSPGAQRTIHSMSAQSNKVEHWAEFLMPDHAKAAGVLRPSVLRKMAGHHRESIRLGNAALRGNLSLRRAAERRSEASCRRSRTHQPRRAVACSTSMCSTA